MGMTSRQQVVGRRVAVALSLVAGAVFVAAGIAGDDLVTVGVGVVIPVLVLLLSGPATRWLRRGDGPYRTRSETDDDREAYVRLRNSGGNGYGR